MFVETVLDLFARRQPLKEEITTFLEGYLVFLLYLTLHLKY